MAQSDRHGPKTGELPQDKHDSAIYRAFLKEELRAAARYVQLSKVERDPSRRKIFADMAASEMRHARHWATLLGQDASTLSPARNSQGLWTLSLMARIFGPSRLLPLLVRGESAGAQQYATLPAAAPLVAEERQHQSALRKLALGKADGDNPHPEGGFLNGGGGTLRAAVLGINDGLVSNFSLVMGVAGGTDNSSFIILAGVAGLLAGAFSMAAGEYISVQSQRDVYENMIRRERAEIDQWPAEEQKELSLIYQRKGLTEAEANLVSARLMSNKQVALETKVREELGIDLHNLGSPWGAAIYSMVAFAAGAIVPIMPFLLGATGLGGVGISASVSALALASVGGGLAWFSGINALWGATRMVMVGAAAAGVTFGIGKAIGVTIDA